MGLSKIASASILCLDAVPVEIEVDAEAHPEKATIVMVGLPDAAVRESKDRVLASIKNSGFSIGLIQCTINLAPGDLRKEGPFYDLPIAMGLLQAVGHLSQSTPLEDYLIVGELGLGGETRAIHGALAITILAKQLGRKGLILPASNAKEAAAVPGIDVYGVKSLAEAVAIVQSPEKVEPFPHEISESLFTSVMPSIDFADIKGQLHVKRAMEITAAGAHNIVLSGPPGSGKTMLAKALIGIMPEMTIEESLETTKIHSVAGLLREGHSLVTQRPFRSPHHTVSYAGLIGGGAYPRPGEVSLAHNGILFLDELPEFSRTVLEVLRQPLEDRRVTISRANGNYTYPTSFICVAAMNPCPCGNLGHPDKPCRDSAFQIERYRGKISGPLWDRIDMHLDVPAQRYQDIIAAGKEESSQAIRQRVKEGRFRQRKRFGGAKTNAQMSSREVRHHCILDTESHNILRQAIDVMGISARAVDRVLRVSLTIADLLGEPLQSKHVMEALNYRNAPIPPVHHLL